MEILGIGMPELIFIFIIAILVMGPKDMQKAGKTIGTWLRKVVTSDGWKMWQQTSRELRTLPNRLMREANEELNQVNQIGKELTKSVGIPNAKDFAPINQPDVIISTPEEKPAKPTPESDPEQNA